MTSPGPYGFMSEEAARHIAELEVALGFANADNKRLVEANLVQGQQIERLIKERDEARDEAEWLRNEEAKKNAEVTKLTREMNELRAKLGLR